MAYATAASGAVMCGMGATPVFAQACSRSDFEGAVGEAANTLRVLNLKNKPTYQGKLRQLKDQRGWSHEVFLKEAAPLVQDATILAYDQTSGDLLQQINTMGQDGAQESAPDCTLLEKLRQYMAELVKTQEAKWSYMFQRIDAELQK